jgi:hypothetical protein
MDKLAVGDNLRLGVCFTLTLYYFTYLLYSYGFHLRPCSVIPIPCGLECIAMYWDVF